MHGREAHAASLAIQARRKVGLCKGLASAADARLRLEDHDVVPSSGELACSGEPGEPGADDNDLLAIARLGQPVFGGVGVLSVLRPREVGAHVLCAVELPLAKQAVHVIAQELLMNFDRRPHVSLSVRPLDGRRVVLPHDLPAGRCLLLLLDQPSPLVRR